MMEKEMISIASSEAEEIVATIEKDLRRILKRYGINDEDLSVVHEGTDNVEATYAFYYKGEKIFALVRNLWGYRPVWICFYYNGIGVCPNWIIRYKHNKMKLKDIPVLIAAFIIMIFYLLPKAIDNNVLFSLLKSDKSSFKFSTVFKGYNDHWMTLLVPVQRTKKIQAKLVLGDREYIETIESVDECQRVAAAIGALFI